jgi:hypothetical protein
MMIRFRLLWAALLVDAYSFPLRAKYLGQELTKHRFSLSRQFHALKFRSQSVIGQAED